MDTSKLSQGQMIAAIGGVVLIISLFLNWDESFTGQSAFDAFSGMDIIMLLIGVAAIGFAGAAMMDASGSLPPASAMILTALGIGLVGWSLGWDLEDPSAGFGAWIGLFASIAIAYGAYAAARAPAVAPARARPAGPTPPAGSSEPPAA